MVWSMASDLAVVFADLAAAGLKIDDRCSCRLPACGGRLEGTARISACDWPSPSSNSDGIGTGGWERMRNRFDRAGGANGTAGPAGDAEFGWLAEGRGYATAHAAALKRQRADLHHLVAHAGHTFRTRYNRSCRRIVLGMPSGEEIRISSRMRQTPQVMQGAFSPRGRSNRHFPTPMS